jgi:cystathionine gamma-lyase
MKFTTKAVHAGEEPDFRAGATGDVVAPLHLSTTFARQCTAIPTAGYEYTRSDNPTRHALETKLAAIENAAYGLAFSSGLAAETVVLLTLARPGTHIIAFDDLYGGSKRLLNNVFNEYGAEVTYVDATSLKEVENALRPNTQIVWLETPSNPLLKVCDIRTIAAWAHTNGLITIVDNTFLSPYFQHPLELGADIALHSTTKYIGGHSDTLGGAVALNDKPLYERLRYHQNAVGAVLSPFDSYLTLRGIKTLSLRMERHQHNALGIARFLCEQPQVKRVIYPGLENHPQYALNRSQSSGFGGVLSFELHGSQHDAEEFLERLKLFALAESLGGVESLIELPATMTHSSVPPEVRKLIGVSDTLIRLSAGIEDLDDLLDDLRQALI